MRQDVAPPQNKLAAMSVHQLRRTDCWGALLSAGPSTTRWGSTSVALVGELAGDMFHGILGRPLKEAFATWQAGEAGEEGEDRRKVFRAKVWRANKYFEYRDRIRMRAVQCWATESIDNFRAHLQRLHSRAVIFKDLQHVGLYPFHNASWRWQVCSPRHLHLES